MHLLRSAVLYAALACALALGPAVADATPGTVPGAPSSAATCPPAPSPPDATATPKVTPAQATTTATSSASSHAEVRRISLQGGRNMRSLDGLPVRGGTLRPGALYRSARLTHLSATDTTRVNALALATIVDVRMGLESMFQGPDTADLRGRRLYLPMHAPISPSKSFYLKILDNKNSQKSIGRFFATLADDRAYPLLYHCGIGKDRTGTLTALLLEMLGTPRDIIFDDYLASGKTANRAWLQSVFDLVDQRGGIEAYLKELGVTPAQVAAIRHYLVVPLTN